MPTHNSNFKVPAIIAIPLLFGLSLRFIFGLNSVEAIYSVMGLSFLFLVPFGIGALTIYLSSKENASRRAYRVFMPWAPIGAFFLLTLLLGWEGWACWLMVLPLFLLAASLGGKVAARYKLRDRNRERIYVSLIALLPLVVSPAEQLIKKIPGQYRAYTYIDIHASKENIWKNVTRVSEIAEKQDKGWFTRMLGFPRPIRAELNYEGVGAYRKAIFDKGLIFDETVTAYNHQRSMSFTIKADPYNIPSTTMDEHVVIGGKYFDVLDGTYELQPLSDGNFRLHLYSHFELNTTFNFYASWWASWIMKDIQNNILQVIRQRAESNSPEHGI
ncbi:DUF2029 domain-containing protein [Chitinophaga sp. HK235]|uniref:DUF2029 domain-containing protein n=1 Tax=Chitinophaga sp. HK235 TaxID=2952571 RepID=UPI001BA9835C|nr:DUF2029 domain-containing protein [Chitinophaga sp. HK235]